MEDLKNVIIVDEYEHAFIAGIIMSELIDAERYGILKAVGLDKIERLLKKLEEINDKLPMIREEEEQRVIKLLSKVLSGFGIY